MTLRGSRPPKSLLLLLAWTLLLAQTAAYAHAVLHGGWGGLHHHAHATDCGHHVQQDQAGHCHADQAAADHPVGAPANWVAQLFDGHSDESGCQLFHANAQPGLCNTTAPTDAAVLPHGYLARSEGEAKARWAALFDARGPPLFH